MTIVQLEFDFAADITKQHFAAANFWFPWRPTAYMLFKTFNRTD